MASQSGSTSVGVGSTNTPTIVNIIPTTRNPKVWDYYNLVELSDGTMKAHCKNCGKFLKHESNTTLKVHTEKFCQTLKKAPEVGQGSMARDGTIFCYDADRVRDRLAKFVIQEALPFNHFDNPRLTKLIQETLQPRYNHVSRATLRRDCLKLWKKAKIELIKGFELLQTGVNLTTDVWSAPHGLPGSYICVTAHWVDPNSWLMMKRTIAFENFEYPHTGDNLFYMLDDVLSTFKIEEKVFSISFDNATNNTNAVEKMKLKFKPINQGIFYHSRCVAHIINLVVQDGLAVEDVKIIVGALKTMLSDVFCSGKTRYKKYMKLCHETNSIFLTPNWDIPTRWNSTYNMLLCALRQKNTLQLFHDDLAQHGRVAPIPPQIWENIEKITDFLEVFKNATTLLSGVYYPTSCFVLRQLFLMCSKINEIEFAGEIYENMIAPMKEKLKKYFAEIPPVITCAAALNPCFNVSGVETLIDSICDDLDLNLEKPFFSRDAKVYFNTCLQELFDTYFLKYGFSTTTQQGSTSAGPTMTTSKSSILNLYNTLRNENSKRARGSTNASELGRYSGTDFLSTMGPEEFENFDILAWWKGRESQFPVLAAMARDLLTAQASTVASESAFSLSGRVLSIRRTRLTPTALEMCICLKDHLDAAERIQHVRSLEVGLEVEEEIQEDEAQMGYSISLSDEEIALDEMQAQQL